MATSRFNLLFKIILQWKLVAKDWFLTYSFLSSQYDCSCKVISAFLESPDPTVLKLVKKELQPLIDIGILKNPKPIEQANQ